MPFYKKNDIVSDVFFINKGEVKVYLLKQDSNRAYC